MYLESDYAQLIPLNPILDELFRMVKLSEYSGFDKIEDNRKKYNNTTSEYQIEFDSVYE